MQALKTVLIFVFLGVHWSFAQEKQKITLEDFLDQVEIQNLDNRIAKAAVEMAKADKINSLAAFSPHISVSHTGLRTTNPLQAFGVKLNQEILTSNDFNPDLLNNPKSISGFSTSLKLNQPLINISGINQHRAAQKLEEATELTLEHTKQAQRTTAKQLYYTLQFTYERKSVVEQAILALESHLKFAKNAFEQGILHKSDLLSIEVQLLTLKTSSHQINDELLLISDRMNAMKNSPLGKLLVPDQPMQELLPNHDDRAFNEQRNDLMAFRLQQDAMEYEFKSSKSNYLPTLNAFADYSLHDQSVLGMDAKGHTVGISLNWNIFQGFSRIGSIKKSKARLDNSKLAISKYDQIQKQEFLKISQQIKTLRSLFEMTQLSMEQAKESLRIKSNRFKEGMERVSDLLSAESEYLNQQLNHLSSIYQYQSAYALYEFLTK